MKLGENVLKGIAKFDDAEKARQFVAACEKDFEGRLDEIAEKVAANKALHLVALSGPSCSGKTTTANKLISELEARGRRVHVVSIDDFYYDKDILNNMAAETGEIDYESIRSIDFEALVECVNEIFSDGITKVPRFDFKTGGFHVDAGENRHSSSLLFLSVCCSREGRRFFMPPDGRRKG